MSGEIVRRRRPKKTPNRSKYSCVMAKAAQYLNISVAVLRNAIQQNTLLSTRIYHGSKELRISFAELHEFARYNNLDASKVPVKRDVAWIGVPFTKDIKENDGSDACLHRFLLSSKGFDGTCYLSPRAIKYLKQPELEFVCRNLFRYNQIVVRHRPFACLRHVVMTYDKKTLPIAEKWKQVIDNLYPGCVVLKPFEHIFNLRSQWKN